MISKNPVPNTIWKLGCNYQKCFERLDYSSSVILNWIDTLVVHSAEEERPTAAHLLSRGRPANKDTPKPKTTLIINFPNSAVHVI